MNRPPIAVLLAAMWLATAAVTARGACESSVAGDQQFVETQLAVLAQLVPALPPGWRVYETRSTPLVRQTHCRAGEVGAFPAPPLVEYELLALPEGAPQFRIRELDAQRATVRAGQQAEVARATRRVQVASRSGDMTALQIANADLQAAIAALQANQKAALAAVRAVDSLRSRPQAATLRISLRVNADTLASCAGWTPETAPGTAFAARFDAPPACATGPLAGADVRAASVRGYGDWAREGERWLARFAPARATRELPLYARYTLWIVVRGGDAASVAAVTASLDQAHAAAALAFAHAE